MEASLPSCCTTWKLGQRGCSVWLQSITRENSGTHGMWMLLVCLLTYQTVWNATNYQWFWKNFSANFIQLIWLLLDCNEKLQPPSFVSSPSNIFFKRGENVNLQFKVFGFPEPRLDFYNNGKLLRNNEVYTIGTFT